MSAPGSPLRRALPALALATLPLLGGCVAAAAIPVLASGAMATTSLAKKPGHRGQPRVALPAEPTVANAAEATSGPPAPAAAIVRTQDFSDGSRVEVSMPARRSAVSATQSPLVGAAPAPGPGAAGSAAALPTRSAAVAPRSAPRTPVVTQSLPDGTRVTLIPGALPAPSSAGIGPVGDYAAFGGYAARQGTIPVVGNERRSAMLADPGTLNPKTRMCSVQPAAVMIDLDPAGATLDLARPANANPALAATLAELRAQDIVIAWVSSLTADRAGAVRKALVASGLDPAGRDQLVLLRFPEERKQTRREDTAKELCVVALAGDERADFDELYQYLKSPAAGAPLEPLVGNGWFVIPTPLS